MKHGQSSIVIVVMKMITMILTIIKINIDINNNKDLQSWDADEDIFVDAKFPENYRCIMSGNSERGKTYLF